MTRIKDSRKINGLTQQELAAIVGVSRSTIAMWETDKSQPDNDPLLKLAQYFNVSVDYLLGRDEDTKKEPAANTGGELSGIDAELYELLMGLPDDKLQDAMRYVRYLKSLPDNE